MFDIGFGEMLLVALVALIVLGPEQMIKSARVLGRLIGRAKRTLAEVSREIEGS